MQRTWILGALLSLVAIPPAMAYGQQISCTARGMEIDITFYSQSTVRVYKHPKNINPDTKSLVVVKRHGAHTSRKVNYNGNHTIVRF